MSGNVKVIDLDGDSSEESDLESVQGLNSGKNKTPVNSQVDDNESMITDTDESDEDSSDESEAEPMKVGGVDKVSDDDKNDSDSDSDSDVSTTELLASDPLYFVLSRFFNTNEGKSIVTVLDEINDKLGKIVKAMKK